MNGQLSVALVSYLNALPFRYGLLQPGASSHFAVQEAVPSRCADLVRRGEVDIALLPLAELDSVPGYSLFSAFCIGALGPVRTVCLFSASPIERVERIYLDGDSRTSARLARYLASARWGIAPQYCSLDGLGSLGYLRSSDAVLLIGDKVFEHEECHAHRYDLAEEWQQQVGLPAVFAVWVMRNELRGSGVEGIFDSCLAYGVERVGEALAWYSGDVPKEEAARYLTGNIAYWFDWPMVRGAAALGRAVWGNGE